MNCVPSTLVALLAGAAMLTSVEVNAQGRGPSAMELRGRQNVDPAAARLEERARLDAWLRRLVGRFRTDANGMTAAKGLLDCVGIGAGPGVQCVFGRGPADQQEPSAPTMILYGVDPGDVGIRYLQVNDQSIAEGGLGKLEGDTVTFRGTCPLPAHVPLGGRFQPPIVVSCDLKVRIYAPAGGREILFEKTQEERQVVHTARGIRIVMQPSVQNSRLERVSQVQAGAAAAAALSQSAR